MRTAARYLHSFWEEPMRHSPVLISLVAASSFAAIAAFGQGAQQSVALTKIDVVKVASGYRASKVLGESVVNDADETIGKVDEIILSAEGKSAFVILSVGSFLAGTKLIAQPYDSMKVINNKLTMPGPQRRPSRFSQSLSTSRGPPFW